MRSERLDASLRNRPAVFLLAAALALPAAAQAAVGVSEIAGKDGDGAVTIFYPSSSEAQPLKRGPFTLDFASQGALSSSRTAPAAPPGCTPTWLAPWSKAVSWWLCPSTAATTSRT